MEKNNIFEIENLKNKNESNFLKSFIFRNKELFFLVIAPVLIYFTKVENEFKPLLYCIFSIAIIQVVVLKIIRFYSKKTIRVHFQENKIIINYRFGLIEKTKTLSLESTSVELFILKDHRSFFQGIQLNILNLTYREKYKLYDSDWSYLDIELIYNEFKRRKSEEIPENEKIPYEQLKLLNLKESNTNDFIHN
ncbi:MAG: hypothetical protein LCH37_09125 [Bacteroidetes bacterium]|nr:hypothetical protein [Bacteroidota bacterium]